MKTDDDMFIDVYATHHFSKKYLHTKDYQVKRIQIFAKYAPNM